MSTLVSDWSKTELEFAREVRAGLTREGQKELPCSYFYDEVGSALFEVITLLPEYGLTRADARLVERHAGEIAEFITGGVVAELGSGTGTKTRHILQALCLDGAATYYPIDVSAMALARCAQELHGVARVVPMRHSYMEGLREVVWRRAPGQPLLVLFLGSTIGNFGKVAACGFLREVRLALRPGDALLVGADLVKPVARMLTAYDDPAGVTAAFNRNVLARINRELDADFDLREFAHEARYDHRERRIEMHLRALERQRVTIPGAGLCVEFAPGETIWTESSHKYEPDEIRRMGEDAGFLCQAQWIDTEWPFAETLFAAVP